MGAASRREGFRAGAGDEAVKDIGEKRDFKTFMKWFEGVPSDAVFEMGKGPIRVEDY